MKQFFKMFFASLLALVVGSLIVLFMVIGVIATVADEATSDKESDVDDNSVLVIESDKIIHEQGERNKLALFSGDIAYSPGLYDMIQAIREAKEDKNINGIMLRLGFNPNGWATINQLRTALLDFKKSGKFIYAYGEMIPQKSYYLASAADSIFLNPVGFTEFNGLSSEIPFFKGTLEKLEVDPLIFYAGKFKSATEPFRADKMSEPNRQQVSELQSNIWNELTAAVAAHAGTTQAAIHQLAQTGAVQFPEDALRHRLVDGLMYIDQVEDRIRKKTGGKADEKIRYLDMEEYVSNVRRKSNSNKDRIAVLIAEGSINDGEKSDDFEIASKDFIEEIRKIRKNERIKAVVLRVNSPGGSALASEVILRELQLLRAKKPVIVSMGDVAASGGYYISCASDSIFALPNTITGSIGVFTMMFNAERLMKNKLGISFDGVKNAPYADFPSFTRAMTPGESAKMQSIVDTIYNTFKRRVASARRMPVALVDSFAQGRVWSGTEAKRIGLVDGLGDLDRAIASAARKAGITKYRLVTYPQPSDRFDRMFRRFGNVAAGREVVQSAVRESLGEEYNLVRQIRNLQRMNGKAQMLLPFNLSIQ